MAFQTFQQEYMQMPPITRAYTTACVVTTLAVVCMFYFSFIAHTAANIFSQYAVLHVAALVRIDL